MGIKQTKYPAMCDDATTSDCPRCLYTLARWRSCFEQQTYFVVQTGDGYLLTTRMADGRVKAIINGTTITEITD